MVSDQSIEQLRNIGPTSGPWLRAVGIETTTELARLGALFADRWVRDQHPSLGLNWLWLLPAGLEDRN